MNTTRTWLARHQELAEATDDELQNMEQEGMLMNSSKELDSLDLSQSDFGGESSNQVPQENLIGVIEENVVTNKESKNSNAMSKEELKIRRELEIEIERDLENEIKENICQLAFRLHRLYQHQNERINTTARDLKLFANGIRSSQVKNGTIFSEMNIRIRMKGGSKVEIKEIKKGNPEKGGRPPHISAFEYKKQDWVKALRSNSTIENKKLHHPRMLKRKSSNMDSKSLGLGWKC